MVPTCEVQQAGGGQVEEEVGQVEYARGQAQKLSSKPGNYHMSIWVELSLALED